MLQSGVGVSLGSGFGGYIMHKYNARFMYRCMSCIVLSMLLVQLIGSIIVRISFYSSSSSSSSSSFTSAAINEVEDDGNNNSNSHGNGRRGREHNQSFLPDYTSKDTTMTTATATTSRSTSSTTTDDLGIVTPASIDNAREEEQGQDSS